MAVEREIRISVRELAEYAYCSGDLDSRFAGMGRALEGAVQHQIIQDLRKKEAAEAGGCFRKEVAISKKIQYRELVFIVSGRIDGLIEDSRGFIVEEIKTTLRSLENIEENTYPAHWAQAECYACMYASENEAKPVGIRLTYYNAESGEQKVFFKPAQIEELEMNFTGMLNKYCSWVYKMFEWGKLRDSTIAAMAFPYVEYRRNQRKLAAAVYKTIDASKRIFIQAPTGTGKTISALFPAIKTMGEAKADKIFYLTAKTVTGQVALDALRRMQDKGLRIKAIVITAKDKICFKEESDCNPEYCEYARGYFDKVNEVIEEIFSQEEIITEETVGKYARKHGMCPYELSLDLSVWMDCIICDYNYVFDPRASLKRFFSEKEKDYVLLIDEAHNLVDRAREMFSAELRKKPFLRVKRLMKDKSPALSKTAGRINSILLELKKKTEGRNCRITGEELLPISTALKDFAGIGEEWLRSGRREEGYRDILELYFEVMDFLRVYELFDERYAAYVEMLENDMRLRLFCLDPSKLLGAITGNMRASVLYSATLTPLHYFKDMLGGDEKDYSIKLASPFESSNLCLTIAGNISTRYADRENSINDIADYIKTAAECRKGNYLVFFPSYRYMDEVYKVFTAKCPEMATILQQPAMQEEEKENFLRRFQEDPGKGLIGFAVMGGVFSEGIDLQGDRLIGAVIVGVGIPQICFERDLVMEFFKVKNNMGFEYAYMYPGLNKVMQAAGRVIRSESDRGMVLLIDERFMSSRYAGMFPREWLHNKRVGSPEELEAILKEFWKNAQHSSVNML